ncbi:hypothetical protein [Halomonas sp. Mc5H-6]|uniref:hypothetical protein n=1 Tax=Halomonas sp. Mc5H-6 TaxID=2954500 RepID=UPI002097921D|nr:hypothetical protein [Halomonas sp. Mc5H-6]MCO7246393.1 hypothetical protein [Halomonas sp. Mc5H-6]
MYSPSALHANTERRLPSFATLGPVSRFPRVSNVSGQSSGEVPPMDSVTAFLFGVLFGVFLVIACAAGAFCWGAEGLDDQGEPRND